MCICFALANASEEYAIDAYPILTIYPKNQYKFQWANLKEDKLEHIVSRLKAVAKYDPTIFVEIDFTGADADQLAAAIKLLKECGIKNILVRGQAVKLSQ